MSRMQTPQERRDPKEVDAEVERILAECERYAREGAYLFALSKCRLALNLLRGKL